MAISSEIEICATLTRRELSRFMYLIFDERKKHHPETKFVKKDLQLHFADAEGPDPYFVYKNGVNKHVGRNFSRSTCANYVHQQVNTLVLLIFLFKNIIYRTMC